MTNDINVLALVKGEERYIFLYDDARRTECLRTLGRFASNPDLSFSWYDAAVLSQRIRQTAADAEKQAAEPVAQEPHLAGPHLNHPRPRFKLPLPTEENEL